MSEVMDPPHAVAATTPPIVEIRGVYKRFSRSSTSPRSWRGGWA
ncbi:hypothetical protein ACFQU2_31310 [Siccirubricoccus deserti]